eukprot:GEMP01079584.1.p1 GENE.GEMP01079584.1~~GEMP01079584.1.p1  ORF type:complete len:130 (+),score=11.64 GEMP01079584.1:670-1059(+)
MFQCGHASQTIKGRSIVHWELGDTGPLQPVQKPEKFIMRPYSSRPRKAGGLRSKKKIARQCPILFTDNFIRQGVAPVNTWDLAAGVVLECNGERFVGPNAEDSSYCLWRHKILEPTPVTMRFSKRNIKQ